MSYFKKNKDNYKYPMIKWAKDLFPICRSLTGDGAIKTIKYFIKLNKEFKVIKFKSGKKVFDWTIPDEWNIKDAYIQHESGKKFAQFKKLNLHVVGYSTPINKVLSKNELLKKVYTLKKQPGHTPYVTSYYKKNWGFCMSENEKKKLPQGKYRVFINSSLKKGNLNIIHSKFKGKSSKEIFFSSYFCHPSMANNELSGPVLMNALMLYLKKTYPNPKYSYRFVLLPETIGSIAYLSKFKRELKKNVICGLNLTCVGDERKYSIIHSPSEKTLADQALNSALIGYKNVKKYSFLQRGSDERQYCSPGIDLPLACFSRSKYYPEYHTNKDDFKVVTQKGLSQSFEVVKNIIDSFETGLYPKYKYLCEPNLGKRNMYHTISSKHDEDTLYSNYDPFIKKNILAYANGKRSIFEISNILQLPLSRFLEQYKILKLNNLIK
jgi:aminopeptidase-like protein